MKEKLAAAAAIAESEAKQAKDEDDEEDDDENSFSEHKSRHRRRSSEAFSLSQLDTKSSGEIKKPVLRTQSLDSDRQLKIKKQNSVDSGNDASSEDSNDSKRLF